MRTLVTLQNRNSVGRGSLPLANLELQFRAQLDRLRDMARFRSRKFPVIILDILETDGLLPLVVAEARREGLRFLDVTKTRGNIPSDCQVVGVISIRPSTQRPYRGLLAADVPTIRVGTHIAPQMTDNPIVTSDIHAVGVMAAEHFKSRGLKHVCYIGQKPWANPPVLYDGLKEQAEKLGCDVHLRRFEDPGDAATRDPSMEKLGQYREKRLKEWLRELPKPIGILAYGVKFAMLIDITCESLGISVPGEVSILNAMDTQNCECSYTPLSAVNIDREQIARRAISSLKRLIDGHKLSCRLQLVPPVGVVVRKSTDIVAVDDPVVARALSFIVRHLEWPITVEDVADYAGVPRRRLAAAFKRALGHSVNEDIRQRRLTQACELLRTEDMPISKITTAIGFSSKTYFHKVFLCEYGMTPHDYRKKHGR